MNQVLENNDVLTKSFFVEVMLGVNGKFDRIDKRLNSLEKESKKHSKKFEIINNKFDIINNKLEIIDHKFEIIDKKLTIINGKFEIIDYKFEVIDGNFRRIYDAIEDLSIKLEEYREENQREHQITRNDMNGHFDHIYKKLENHDNEWTCMNAWIARHDEKDKTSYCI